MTSIDWLGDFNVKCSTSARHPRYWTPMKENLRQARVHMLLSIMIFHVKRYSHGSLFICLEPENIHVYAFNTDRVNIILALKRQYVKMEVDSTRDLVQQ